MNWIDQERRDTWSRRKHLPIGVVRANELDRLLTEEMKKRALAIGNELIFSYEDALAAIGIATEHEIAVLGFEAGEVRHDGFQVVDYNGYEFRFCGDWNEFVRMNNTEAERWITEHRFGKNYGYVVTSTSEREFAELQQQRDTL
jgi:hypothetical protein